MLITSVNFALFVGILFVVYWLCPARFRWGILLVGSICFYAFAGIEFLPFIFVTSFSVWLGARQIGCIWSNQDQDFKKAKFSIEEKKARKIKDKKKAKFILLLVLFLNIGYLIFEKTVNYLSLQFDGFSFAEKLIIPLGISYYTFTAIGYILDVYWRRYPYEKNYARFALYAIYFPHIVQGPISRYNKLGAELKKELLVSYDNFVMGMQLVLWGYFKKLVIADRLALYTTAVFSSAHNDGMLYIVGVFFDVIHIYADFSGYMDIMRGVSQVFGIELEENFKRPFLSKTVPEFWRRWHMTLGGWFRDYVYTPITVSEWYKKLYKRLKSNASEIPATIIVTGIPVIITWSLTGLWHGTGLGYLMWGLYYGSLITCSVALGERPQKLVKRIGCNVESVGYRFLQSARIFCVFAIGRILTKMPDFVDSLRIFKRILCDTHLDVLYDGTIFSYGLNEFNFVVSIIGIVSLWLVSMLQEKDSVRTQISRRNIVFRWIIYIGCIFAIFILGVYGGEYSTEGFAYQQF